MWALHRARSPFLTEVLEGTKNIVDLHQLDKQGFIMLVETLGYNNPDADVANEINNLT
jgi:hypothetical protein